MRDDTSPDAIWIGPHFSIPATELEFLSTRASGPGGQHVNRTASAVQLRFDVLSSPSLPPAVRTRLLFLARGRLTSEGILLIDAQEHRSQKKNREAALERFTELLLAAATPPKPRRPTKPTRASRERRLRTKRLHSDKKRQRRQTGEYE
ncbi:MAG TPA: alternative ribosome rescue aminoacyl-tRNA hydrolase ArfB [Lentisphaeria bacterium]|nr:alternative ribosome rescue aminoacyl-tRNA hydrolase ArfB [Lentisphaeria bacterium]